MTTIDLRLPRLHTAQKLIAQSDVRFRVLCCGRRFGKTELIAEQLLLHALKTGRPVAYFSLSYRNIKELWQRLMKYAAPIQTYTNKTDMVMHLMGGGVIECWSVVKADNILGRKYSLIAIDEAAAIPDLQYVWEKTLMPMLADYAGDALFASTPKGFNYFYQLFMRGQDQSQPLWASWQAPTSSNPHIPKSEIELARETLPERTFQQEYLAEFTEDGGVFRGVDAVSTRKRMQPYEGNFVAGVDWARAHDYTVISVWDVDKGIEVDIDRFNQVSWELQRGRLKQMCDKWGVKLVIAEENSLGSPNIEALQIEGLPVEPFQTTAKSKGPLIDALALAVERGECGLLDEPIAIAELKAYQMERLPSGTFRYGAPDGGHDDTVIARCLGWNAVLTTPRFYGGSF